MAKRRVAPGIYERSRGVYDLVVSARKGADGRYRQRSKPAHSISPPLIANW